MLDSKFTEIYDFKWMGGVKTHSTKISDTTDYVFLESSQQLETM